MQRAARLLILAGILGVLPAAPARSGPPAVDRYGDPLPPGVLSRLGTWRLCTHAKVATVLFSLDGKVVVSAAFSAEKRDLTSIRVWDADTGSLVRAFGTEGFEWLALGPDGHTLAAALCRTDIHLFDLRTGKKIGMLEHSEKDQLGSVAFPKVDGVRVRGVNSERGEHRWPAGPTPASSSSRPSAC